MDAAEERALRDALEKAQARARQLATQLSLAENDADENWEAQKAHIEKLEDLLQREVAARDELSETVAQLHAALDGSLVGSPPGSTGEQHERLRLRAELLVIKQDRDRLRAERDRALADLETLGAELHRVTRK